jgi:UDP-glucuronate 4-epimerase
MKIIVTGGAGFIGSNLCQRLIEDSHLVYCIDSFDDFYPKEIKIKNISGLTESDNFTLIEDDINNEFSKKLPQQDYDILIHLAAKAGVRNSFNNPDEYYRTNVNGTYNTLYEAKKINIKKVIFSSSSSVYGNINGDFPISENTSLFPISPYAKTKMAGEKICQEFSITHNISITSLRFFSVYGKNQRPDLLFHKLINCIKNDKKFSIYGDVNSKRDYTHVDDIVDGIILAMEKDLETLYNVYNLGSGNPHSLNEIISIFENLSSKEIKKVFIGSQKGDVNNTYASILNSGKDINYFPKMNIEEGIKKFIDNF